MCSNSMKWSSSAFSSRETLSRVSTFPRPHCSRVLKDFESPNVQEHALCRFILIPAFQGNEAVLGIPRDLISIGIGDDAAATHLLRHLNADTKGFAKKLRTQPFSPETVIDCETGKKNEGQVVRRQAAHMFFGKRIARDRRRGQSEVAENDRGSRFVYSDIGHSDRDLLLIRPRVLLEVVVEEFVFAVEVLDNIMLLQSANDESQLTPHEPD